MPEEDKADILTPADRRRRQRAAILVFSLFLTGVLTLLATTVLAVNNGRNYKRLVRQLGLESYLLPSPPPPDLRVGRLRQLPPSDRFPPRLLAAGLERVALLDKTAPFSAEESCNLLKSEKGTEPTFTTGANDWECLFFEEYGSAAERASLFVHVRGVLPDAMRTFRMKLSLTDPPVEPEVVGAAVAALGRFGLPMTPETTAYLIERLSARDEFTSVVENYRMSFSQEIMDRRRYNLLILPRPQTMACGEPVSPPPDKGARSTYRMPVGCLSLGPTPSGPASLFPEG
ncbi:DUF6030 family protein [Rhizobium puerariae]|uniref:DUF6030 family protein n=1 Tax=Rhizobium puerariae TaxID=1585791 RepID=A0ABV6AKC3_9HYPH